MKLVAFFFFDRESSLGQMKEAQMWLEPQIKIRSGGCREGNITCLKSLPHYRGIPDLEANATMGLAKEPE